MLWISTTPSSCDRIARQRSALWLDARRQCGERIPARSRMAGFVAEDERQRRTRARFPRDGARRLEGGRGESLPNGSFDEEQRQSRLHRLCSHAGEAVAPPTRTRHRRHQRPVPPPAAGRARHVAARPRRSGPALPARKAGPARWPSPRRLSRTRPRTGALVRPAPARLGPRARGRQSWNPSIHSTAARRKRGGLRGRDRSFPVPDRQGGRLHAACTRCGARGRDGEVAVRRDEDQAFVLREDLAPPDRASSSSSPL